MSDMGRSVQLVNDFTRDWARAADYSDNVVLSGLGYYLLGLMLVAAASGEAKDELEVALAVDQADAGEHLKLLTSLLSACDGVTEAVGMWVRPDLPVNEDYKQLVAAGTVDSIPQDISVLDDWVKDATQGIMNKFPVAPDDETRMLLATAVAAKADWKAPFDSGLVKWMGEPLGFDQGLRRVSHDLDQVSIVSYQQTTIGRLVCETVAGFDVHLLVGELSDNPADVLGTGIAACDGVADVVKGSEMGRKNKAGGLTVTKVDAVTNEPWLIVSTPIFKIVNDHDLLEKSELFGLTAATDSSTGHFPGISVEPLAVQKAVQSSIAAFSAEGFEAAAVTVMSAMAGAMADPPKEKALRILFEVDRPFGFMAVDRETNLVLFTGWVNSPSQPRRFASKPELLA